MVKKASCKSSEQRRSFTSTELDLPKEGASKIARIRGVGLFEDKEQIIPGWQGQPKGLLQALWERGMIDKQMPDK
jgi:hypothetical protein